MSQPSNAASPHFLAQTQTSLTADHGGGIAPRTTVVLRMDPASSDALT